MFVNNFHLALTLVYLSVLFIHSCDMRHAKTKYKNQNKDSIGIKVTDRGGHKLVTDATVYPYMAAILVKMHFRCTGALVDDRWVLTAAWPLYRAQDSLNNTQVRLGSINHSRGGIVMPVKYVHIHPYYNSSSAQYDVAIIKLAKKVIYAPNINFIRLLTKPRDVTSTHFIVTSWSVRKSSSQKSSHKKVDDEESKTKIKLHRILSITHLHFSTNQDKCINYQQHMNIIVRNLMMCLDPDERSDYCSKYVGAPVVLNGVLWGVVSSYQPAKCSQSAPTLVSLLSHVSLRSWMQAVFLSQRWTRKMDSLSEENSIESVEEGLNIN